jgi:glycosyltransferase involved in cell wall biosynthesis
MSQEPLISVLVPAYNAEAFLEQCLESIVAQTYRHLEIIVVDDGSTDGTATISDRWAERDDRIRVIHQPNGGLSAARNTALDIMSGKYVAMVDSDDVIHTEFAATLLQAIEAHHASMAVG